MEKITSIVLHHSLTPKKVSLNNCVRSFNRTHKERLHPNPNTLGYHIAYHYLVHATEGVIQTRGENEAGWHASNLEVNNSSIAVCLIGNMDEEKPSKKQLKDLEALIADIRTRHEIKEINGHRVFAPQKSCPGKNISDKYIRSLLIKKETMSDKYKKWAIDNEICRDDNWGKAPTKYETVIMINRADQPTSLKEEFVSHGTSMLINLLGAGTIASGLYYTGMGGQASLLTAVSTVFVLQSGSRATLDKVFNTIVSKFKK